MTLYSSNWGSKFEVKRSKDNVTENENVEIVFRAYLREKWIYLQQRQNDPLPILHMGI